MSMSYVSRVSDHRSRSHSLNCLPCPLEGPTITFKGLSDQFVLSSRLKLRQKANDDTASHVRQSMTANMRVTIY